MRVTTETQRETRRRIVDAARDLFAETGYDATTTRAIATRARIAAGTLFNYFPSKEALAIALVEDAVASAEEEFEASRRAGETLEETLFAWVASWLRHLGPARPWIAGVFEVALSPLRSTGDEGQGSLRRRHLEHVERWIAAALGRPPTTLDLHLWWSLFLGVMTFWARDETHNQESTLALLDRSVGLYCHTLTDPGGSSP